jgi:hypothetical protein
MNNAAISTQLLRHFSRIDATLLFASALIKKLNFSICNVFYIEMPPADAAYILVERPQGSPNVFSELGFYVY